MQTRALLACAAAMTLAVGCGGGSSTTPKKAGPATYTVNVDGQNADLNETFLAYFPKEVMAHPGDSVTFHYKGVGEPHTVTMGAPVNAVLAGFEKLTPAQQQGQPPQALLDMDAKIPSLLPQGPGDANQVVAAPCYIATGAIPAKGSCPSSTPLDFTGQESLVNSGWFDSDAKFTVKLSKTIAPGSYRYMCSLHREGMTGKITVVPAATKVPTPAEQTATGARELQAVEAKLAPAGAALAGGTLQGVKLPTGGAKNVNVLVGSGSQDVQDAQIDAYGPSSVSIPVGGSVTFYYLGDHSVSFNTPQSGKGARSPGAGGQAHLNVASVAPQGGPGEPQSGDSGGPDNGPPSFTVVAKAAWGGLGWFSTGVFLNSFGPPKIEGYKLTFNKAGTYAFLCTVHDKMKGTVKVG